MLRFPLPGVAACLVAGTGLWLTRASMDVATQSGSELRVAMFPSGAELIGLLILPLVVALLLSRALHALWPRRAGGAALPVDPLLPLFSLLWLAVPYLPWLPDRLPALRALAGPARYGLWIVVLGQVIWQTWDLLSRRRVNPAPDQRPGGTARGAWIALLLGVTGFGSAAVVLTAGVSYPTGDEPHYLIAAESLVRDRDLRVGNNYEGHEYRSYYPAPLTPEVVVRDNAAYPARPVGLPILIAPAYAAGGYPGVTMLLVLVAAVSVALAWRWAARASGSAESATFGCLAVAASAPFLLRTCAVGPETAAAFIALVAIGYAPPAGRWNPVAVAGVSLLTGILPWLDLAYLPLCVALVAITAARQRSARTAAVAVLPALVLAAGALVFLRHLWGAIRPAVLAPAVAESASLALRLPALAIDQEYGLLPYAPALVLALPGLVVMCRQSRAVRRRAVEAGIAIASILAASVWSAHELASRQAIVMLPLLILPIAWWRHSVIAHDVLTAVGRVLVLVGVAITSTFVIVNAGMLAAPRGNGSAQLLEWLSPSHDLVRFVPSFIGGDEGTLAPLMLTALWMAAAFGCAAALRRIQALRAGAAAPLALAAVVVTGAVVAIGATVTIEGRLARRIDPVARAESPLLSRFDARARPAAVAYDRWRVLPATAVPALFTFEGRPGLRREPQPIRVVMNTRLALPAGDYEVELQPAPETVLDGSVSLQVGRTGDPVTSWPAHAPGGAVWRQQFRLDVDAAFVGFRAAPEIERAIEGIRVRPLAVLNASNRLDRQLGLPPVLGAARYRDVTTYFHGAAAFPERDGFWVRGASELLVTLARDPAAEATTVRLRLHSGAGANRIRLRTGSWRRLLTLEPGDAAFVEVPLQTEHKTTLRIAAESGFVPADTTGGTDRRLLGCWVEIVD